MYEVIGGAYRKNNVTTIELRFNPMKRNRGGEQDLDHIISAAIRGMDRARARVPGHARADPLPRPRLSLPAQRDHRREGDRLSRSRRGRRRHRRARSRPSFRPADYRRLFDRVRRKGLGITVHTGESGPVEEIAEVIEQLEPSRIGHGVKAAYDPRTMAMIRERGITLEVCPTSTSTRASSPAGTSSAGSSTRSAATGCASPSTPTARRC